MRIQDHLSIFSRNLHIRHTIARWKSGLLPFVVFANRVNWETQSMSPLISFTFFFHCADGSSGSGNSLRDNLRYIGMSSDSNYSGFVDPDILFAMKFKSASVSSGHDSDRQVQSYYHYAW